VNAALAKISPTLKATLDFDSIKALQGKVNWTSKEELDAPVAVLKYFTREYNVLKTVIEAFNKITKDAIGKEAIQSEVEKVFIHIAQDATQTGTFAVDWKVEKKDKELHLTIARDWPTHAKDGNNGYPTEAPLVKAIEAIL
jgi:hypothetical protein